jgi:hypothetical protein
MNNKKLKLIISNKPFPVIIESRPLWRISLVIIIVYVVSGNKKDYLDLKKVNILVWMLIRKRKWQEYENYLSSTNSDIPFISVDTATYKAVELSIAKGFLKLINGRLYLEQGGDNLYSILSNNNIMNDEISFLKKFGTKLSINKIKGLTGS